MIDINRIRENPQGIKEALAKKLWETDFTELLTWDKSRHDLMLVVEGNKAEMNKLSASVPAAKKAGEDVSKIFAKVKEIAASGGAGSNVALLCALSLYVDFIYIFIRLLALVARNRR